MDGSSAITELLTLVPNFTQMFRKYTDYTQPYSVPTSVYHYDPLGPPPAFPGAPDPGHAPHSPAPAHAQWPGVEHSAVAAHPALGTVPHSMTSYYSHPAFLPHAARDLREAQAGMQVNTHKKMIHIHSQLNV